MLLQYIFPGRLSSTAEHEAVETSKPWWSVQLSFAVSTLLDYVVSSMMLSWIKHNDMIIRDLYMHNSARNG